MKKEYIIKYTTKRHNCQMTGFMDYDSAYFQYKKLRATSKALWDITTIPELLHSNFGTGHNGYITDLNSIIDKCKP